MVTNCSVCADYANRQPSEPLKSTISPTLPWKKIDNCLMLNPDKTKLMVFSSRGMLPKLPAFKLSLLGKEIIPAQSVKDHGMIFDPTLSFDNDISATVSSCMSKLCQISRVKFVFNNELLKTIIRLFLVSCIIVRQFGHQRQLAISVSYSTFRTLPPVLYVMLRNMNRNLRWLPVKTNLYYHDTILTFKCMTGHASNV